MINDQGTALKDDDGQLWAVTDAGSKRYLEESNSRYRFVFIIAVIASVVILVPGILMIVSWDNPVFLLIYPLALPFVWSLAIQAGASYERTIIESLGEERVLLCEGLIYWYLSAADRDILITLGREGNEPHWASPVHQFENDLVDRYNAEFYEKLAEENRQKKVAIDQARQKVTEATHEQAPAES